METSVKKLEKSNEPHTSFWNTPLCRTRSSVHTDRACMNLKKNLTSKSKRKTFPRAWNTASWSVKSNFLKRRWKITSLSFWFAQDFRDWTILVMYIPITPINSICSTFDFDCVLVCNCYLHSCRSYYHIRNMESWDQQFTIFRLWCTWVLYE